MPFPPDFLWGAATASYQIEGSVGADGRGESIWDEFSRQPGAVENGHTGAVACDHYRRWESDVDLMVELGLKAYRFSVAWPRLFPDGGEQLNTAGLGFYDRLVDRLLERGIQPVVTLYHWDLPNQLQRVFGGWTSRVTAERFTLYAEAAYRALGDRVPLWITLNEPWVAAMLGYFRGVHAPGLVDFGASLRAAHHLLLGHGRAVALYRSLGLPGRIGVTLNVQPTYPLTDSDADRAAARASDGYTNRWFLDPVFGRGYPADTLALYGGLGADVSFATDADLREVGQPIDFLGVNYYSRRVVSAGDTELGWAVREGPAPGAEITGFNWEIVPDSMVDLFARLRADYPGIPLYITENGAAWRDVPAPNGRVVDEYRIEFLRRHFAAAERVIAEGSDLRGYFVWSLLDNFEWAYGYWPRFGLVYVDYPSQRRIVKESGRWYARVIADNGMP
jgi:beta-glucosidase